MAARIALFAATASACMLVAQSAEGQANKSTPPIATQNQKVPPVASTPPAPKQEEDNIYANDPNWEPDKAKDVAEFERTRVLAEQGDVKAQGHKLMGGLGRPF